MPVALVHGRAVSRGSGFLEDADYCSSGLHGGFTRDRRIPEKGLRGREALAALLAHATRHETWKYVFGGFVAPM